MFGNFKPGHFSSPEAGCLSTDSILDHFLFILVAFKQFGHIFSSNSFVYNILQQRGYMQ